MIRYMKDHKTFFRVIDDEPEESDAEIALVVVKDGERVSLGKCQIILKDFKVS